MLVSVDCIELMNERLAFRFIHLQVLPGLLHVGGFEVIDRKLKLFLVADIAVVNWLATVRVTRPDDVINAVYVLKKSADALQPIREFGRDRIEAQPAAL